MIWLKLVIGVVCGLLGVVWLGQGLNLIKGSFMSAQPQWAVIGAVLVVVAPGWCGPPSATKAGSARHDKDASTLARIASSQPNCNRRDRR